MPLSTSDLAKARESANILLEELQLDAFIYEVEPREDVWVLTIECACEVDGGWETITLQIPKQMLLDSFDDDLTKQQFIDYWKKKLSGCKLREA
jgi:hypothetical protein